MTKLGRILTGTRPTGKLHLGNLEGAVRNWVKLQDDYECLFEVADWHALTTAFEDTGEVKANIKDVIIDLIAAGIDPGKSTIFVQSSIPEHAELHLLLSMLVPVPWLERNPTYKEWMDEGYTATYGLLGYPVLQAADILVYKADTVPVGKDQLPHIELTREIARRFNHLYDEVFPIPQAKLTESPAVLGIDGRKMSKSYGNEITITEEPPVIKTKVQAMFTDPKKIYITDTGHPETCPVFGFHSIYNTEEAQEIAKLCKAAQLGCVECKEKLAQQLIQSLKPIRERRKQLEANPKIIDEIMTTGTKHARQIAKATLAEVKKAMKI